MSSMAKKNDRHKRPLTGIRLHPLMRQQLEALVDRNTSSVTEEIRTAIRERLEKNGLWPPPAKPEEG